MKKEYVNILLILLIILVSVYIIRILKLTGICIMILSILSPLFFGYVLSWVIRPIVDKLKFNRVAITLIIYFLFILLIILIMLKLIPLIIEETKKIVPIIKYYIIHNKTLYNIFNSLNIKSIISFNIKNMNNYLSNIF